MPPFLLEEGERVGLIGRNNGAGKSSFLKLLPRLKNRMNGLIQKQQGTWVLLM
jgi:ATPase subunit of ABC transporter with duplicated ATPase domains